MILVNGLSHLGMAAHLRSYNPGLASAVLVFIPFGLYAVLTIPATTLQLVVTLAIAIGIHAAIALHARQRAMAGRGAIAQA